MSHYVSIFFFWYIQKWANIWLHLTFPPSDCTKPRMQDVFCSVGGFLGGGEYTDLTIQLGKCCANLH